MWIIMAGNIIGGMTFHGPFRDRDTAAQYAWEVLEEMHDCADWWMAELEYHLPDRAPQPERPTNVVNHPSAGWVR